MLNWETNNYANYGPQMGTNKCDNGQNYGMDPHHRVPWMAVERCHRRTCRNHYRTTYRLMLEPHPLRCDLARVCGHDQINALHSGHNLDSLCVQHLARLALQSNAQNPKTLTLFISFPKIPKPQSNYHLVHQQTLKGKQILSKTKRGVLYLLIRN